MFDFGSGSGKAEHDPLIVPGKRQTRVLEELLRRQIARLAPIEDRLGDIRRKIAEADEPREIGPADPFPLGEYGKRNAVALDECRVEPARQEQPDHVGRALRRCLSSDETEILSVPVRLRRAGREIRMVIDGTDPFAVKPDARFQQRLVARAADLGKHGPSCQWHASVPS